MEERNLSVTWRPPEFVIHEIPERGRESPQFEFALILAALAAEARQAAVVSEKTTFQPDLIFGLASVWRPSPLDEIHWPSSDNWRDR